MGLCFFGNKEYLDQRAQARAIERQLRDEKKIESVSYALLLLGTGDSGKSTFCKQMRLLHDDGFTEREFFTHRNVLQENALVSMQKLVKVGMDKIEFADIPINELIQSKELTPKIAEIIEKLWTLPKIREIHETNRHLHLSSATEYYFENVSRFAADNFIPSSEDLIRAKARTTGISETKFVHKQINFSIVDVGGQRSERRKWLHCFDNVNCVIYLAALDEYDLVLEEDDKTNRLEESLTLFREVSASALFRETPFVLFLNKYDLFEKKIHKVPLKTCFNDAPESTSTKACADFIKKKYEANFSGNSLYVYYTTAVDKTDCLRVFEALQDNLLRELTTLTQGYV